MDFKGFRGGGAVKMRTLLSPLGLPKSPALEAKTGGGR